MRTALAVVATLTLTACMKPAGETPEQMNARMQAQGDSVRTYVTASARRYEAAMLANNLDSVTALYATNAIIMPPNMPMARGHDDIKKALGGIMSAATATTGFTITPTNVSANGDVGVESGTWKWEGKMGAATVADSGMYLIHLHRDGSDWKIMEHSWNSMNPPMPMPAPARR